MDIFIGVKKLGMKHVINFCTVRAVKDVWAEIQIQNYFNHSGFDVFYEISFWLNCMLLGCVFCTSYAVK